MDVFYCNDDHAPVAKMAGGKCDSCSKDMRVIGWLSIKKELDEVRQELEEVETQMTELQRETENSKNRE